MDARRESEAAPAKNRTTVERSSEREIVVTRTLDAPARLVFEAWTKPELFKRWWVPKGAPISLVACEMDVRTGGTYRLVFTFTHDTSKRMEFFVKYLGMTPAEAIRSTTVYGGEIMMRGSELGQLKEGYLADLLLVDGDPLANISILRDPKRILAVMKDGVFAKRPDVETEREFVVAA